jgi:hypothetical protein
MIPTVSDKLQIKKFYHLKPGCRVQQPPKKDSKLSFTTIPIKVRFLPGVTLRKLPRPYFAKPATCAFWPSVLPAAKLPNPHNRHELLVGRLKISTRAGIYAPVPTPMSHTQAKTSEIYTKSAERRVLATGGMQALANLEW